MASNYVVTAHKPTAVNACVTGNMSCLCSRTDADQRCDRTGSDWSHHRHHRPLLAARTNWISR